MIRLELTFSHCRSNGEPLTLAQITDAEQQALDVLSDISEEVEMERTGLLRPFGDGVLHRLYLSTRFLTSDRRNVC
jgi:hypothetical protein